MKLLYVAGNRVRIVVIVGVMGVGLLALAAGLWHLGLPPFSRYDPYPWDRVSPENVGMDPTKLKELLDRMKKQNTKALLIIKSDKIVCEWYDDERWYRRDRGRHKRHQTASLTKSLVGSIALGCLIDDGTISVDDPAAKYILQWRDDPVRSQITLRHLASHRSGMIHGKQEDPLPGEDMSWRDAFWRGSLPYSAAIEHTPIIFEPGTRSHYSGPGFAVLGYAMTRSMLPSGPSSIEELLQRRIMGPMGIPREEWKLDKRGTLISGGVTYHAVWSGAWYSARSAAAVGKLMMQNGYWGDVQLLSQTTIESLLAPNDPDAPNVPKLSAGLGWWTNQRGYWPNAPRDAFVGAGHGPNVLIVIPSRELIVIRLGGPFDRSNEMFWEEITERIVDPVLAAIDN